MDASSASLPRTLAEARDFDLSQTTRAAIEAAGQIASALPRRDGRPRAVGLAEVIAGLVAVGERERARSLPAEGQRGIFLIAAALAETLEGLSGASRVAEVVGRASALVVGTPYGDVVLSPRVTACLAEAVRTAEATVGRSRIDARHLIAALIAPSDPGLAAALRRIWRREWAISPDSLRAPILAAIERNPESGENVAAWRRILGVPRVAPAAFAADAPAVGDDALGRRADARRLAELACLADNAPPLAIGLFGDWGSGKSTFMAMMHAEVARIGAAWAGEAASPFTTRVAQIRFNAWSFADANLWASLAVEIFEGLRRAINQVAGPGAGDNLFAEIRGKSSAADAAVDEVRKQREAKEEELRKVNERIETASEAVALVSTPAQGLVSTATIDPTAVGRLVEALAPGHGNSAEVIAREAAEIRSASSEALAVFQRFLKVAKNGSRRTFLLSISLVGTLVAAGFAISVSLGGDSRASLLLSYLMPLVSFVAFSVPYWRRLTAAVVALKPLLDEVKQQRERADAALHARRKAEAEKAQIDAELAALRKEEADAEASASATRSAGETSGGLLRYFLNESEELKSYEREIGMIGRLRRSFERLDRIMQDERDPETREVDRIILYIDDLDRLREDQVVKVLEAVALLLQFRLFVVVVAVDARWLEGALRRFYAGQFSSGQVGPGDYLEKIFQIPFWLSSLQGGRAFGTLAETLMPEGSDTGPLSTGPAEVTSSAAESTADRTYAIDPAELQQPEDDEDAESLRAEVRRLELTKAEVRVLRELLPLAASTPRAAKRFINLYRLARSSRDESSLRRFLGEDGSPPQFAALALMLACQNGLRASQLPEFQRYVRHLPQDGDLSGMADVLIKLSNKEDEGEVFLRSMQASFWSGYSAALEPNLLRAALEEASRYSFHPPGLAPALDRAASPANPAAEQPGSPA